jgi:hypothetical protein
MKIIKVFYVLFLISALGCGNNTNKSLDGKSYQLSSWDVNHPEKQDPDLIVFKNGMMDSEACHQYGFTAAPYKSSYENGVISFSGTISSPAEGIMTIEGKAKENSIEGTMLWKKQGQADIQYGFKGNLKSE